MSTLYQLITNKKHKVGINLELSVSYVSFFLRCPVSIEGFKQELYQQASVIFRKPEK